MWSKSHVAGSLLRRLDLERGRRVEPAQPREQLILPPNLVDRRLGRPHFSQQRDVQVLVRLRGELRLPLVYVVLADGCLNSFEQRRRQRRLAEVEKHLRERELRPKPLAMAGRAIRLRRKPRDRLRLLRLAEQL